MSLAKKYLLASLLIVVVVALSSILLIVQPSDLVASKGSSPTNAVSLTNTAQGTKIEARSTISANNNLTRSYAEQIMAQCKNDIHCPVLALGVVYNKTESSQTMLRTFSDLILLHHETYDDCHDVAHHLGTWLFGYTRNVEKAISYAPPLVCGGGVLHGIFQGYFTTEQVHDIVDKNQITFTHLCPVSQENIINWIYERECIHGIGHGLSALYDYNTTAAVDRCNEFGPQWAQSACARGVFMQNMVRYYETKTIVGDFNKNDLYFPCDRTVDEFMSQCYYYQQSYWLMINGNNVTDAFALCDKISPSEFAKSCYQGMGAELADVAYINPELAITACHLGDQARSYHDDCMRGMLRVVLDDDAKTDLGFELCSLSRSDFKAECYEIVGMWMKMFNTNQQELEIQCTKGPESDYVINCINASPDIGMHIRVFELI